MKKETYNCQMAIDHLIAELEISGTNAQSMLDELIQIYPNCTEQLKSQYQTWEDLALTEVPKASPNMHANFYKMLNDFEEGPTTKQEPTINQEPSAAIKPLWRQSWIRYAAAVALLIGAFFVGRQSSENLPEYDIAQNDNAFNHELEEAFIAIKEGPTANNRLAGIQNLKSFEKPDNKIFDALNQALLYDNNVSVRLSAIETMIHFAEEPEVRAFLIKAIPYQESPIVQIALADAMLSLQETDALNSFKKLLESGKLELEVKDHLENTVKELM